MVLTLFAPFKILKKDDVDQKYLNNSYKSILDFSFSTGLETTFLYNYQN